MCSTYKVSRDNSQQAILTQENVRKENNIHKQFDKNLKHTQHSENAENGK